MPTAAVRRVLPLARTHSPYRRHLASRRADVAADAVEQRLAPATAQLVRVRLPHRRVERLAAPRLVPRTVVQLARRRAERLHQLLALEQQLLSSACMRLQPGHAGGRWGTLGHAGARWDMYVCVGMCI